MTLSGLAIIVVTIITLYDAIYPTGELIGTPEVTPPYVRAGQSATVNWGTFVKHRDCRGWILRHLEDGSRVTLAPSASTLEPGVYENFRTTVDVPPYMPPGTWYFRAVIEYRCFPWTWHREELPPVEITVLPRQG